MKKALMILAGLMVLESQAQAINKSSLELHLRKTLNLDTRNQIVVGDPAPALFGDLSIVPVTIQNNKYQIYLSKDERKYLWGTLADLTVDPDLDRLKMINLQGAHSQGSEKAPVTIVEYSDIQCPHCRDVHTMFRDHLYNSYTKDQVRLVFKPFPLTGHDWAESAAIACECAGVQKPEAFWEMTDLFFENAPTTSSTTVKALTMEFGSKLKLREVDFKQCLDDPAMLEKIKTVKIEGMGAGVNSTPTLFVNGRVRRGAKDFEDIKVVIEEKLREAKKK